MSLYTLWVWNAHWEMWGGDQPFKEEKLYACPSISFALLPQEFNGCSLIRSYLPPCYSMKLHQWSMHCMLCWGGGQLDSLKEANLLMSL